MRNFIASIIILLVLIYIWLWFIKQGFSHTQIQKKTLIISFVLSACIVAFLFFYQNILSLFNISNLYFGLQGNPITIGIFILYCILGAFLLSFLTHGLKKKDVFLTLLVAILFFTALAFGAYALGFTTILIYYFLSVYAEELFKFIGGKNIFSQNSSFPSNLIFYCILIAFSFSVIENFLYISIPFFSQEAAPLGIALGRGVFGSLLHVVATGMIAYISLRPHLTSYDIQKKILFLLLALFCGFLFHLVYNLSMNYQYTILGILLLVFSYFFLSYFLFQTSVLYKKEK